MTQDKVTSSYDKAEEWCKSVVKKGHDLLYHTDVFDDEMNKASKDLGFPIEVK